MAEQQPIREHMDVIGADGAPIGQVDVVEGGRIKLTRQSSPDGEHHYIPLSEVARVDRQVQLRISRAELFGTAGAGAAMAAGAADASARSDPRPASDTESSLPPIRNPAVAGAAPRKNYMLPWVLLGLVVLGLLLALSRCGTTDAEKRGEAVQRDQAAQGMARAAAGGAATAGATAAATTARGFDQGTLAYDVNQYLISNARAERRFAFGNLNFDTASARIRGEDRSDIVQLAEVLNAHPGTRAAVIGYADARGNGGANAQLGADRARAVIAALQRRGVDTGAIAARTGGEGSPRGDNRTSLGQAENRRTEFVLIGR